MHSHGLAFLIMYTTAKENELYTNMIVMRQSLIFVLSQP